MPRTLPAALTTVMDAGRYEAYLRVVVNSSPSDTGATTVQPLGFRLEALRATIKIAKFSNDITKYRFFRLVRGATINGTPSTISSVWFTSNDITFDGKFFNIKGELFDRSYQVADADSTYEEVIEFVSGQSSEILAWSYEGAAAWKNYKFYPTGRNVVVTPPMKLFTILRQKFLIFATEDGYDGANSSIFFFVATESRATDYTFTDVLFQGNEHTESRRLLSRDENNTIEINGTITHPLHNLGFIHSGDSQPTNTPNPYVGARSSKLPVHLKYRTGDHAVCLGDGTGLNELDSRINVIEVLDLESTPAWYQIIEALVWFGGTEGGSMPSTIEAAAPYTPLATGNFDGILTEEDNNLQAAMETIDDHEHAGSTESFALTGDISPSQITSNQNDYNPTGLSTATVLRLSTDASRNITGLQGGADGRLIFIHNVGSNDIVLKDADTNSSAANRFAFSADITMAADDGVILQYDSTSSRWRCIGKSPGGGGTSFSDAEGDPADLATAAADGTSTYAARRDHAHKGFTQGARVYHNANQSISNATLTAAAFNSERWDTDTIHDTSTNNSRLTCKTAGKYLVAANFEYASNATGFRYVQIRKNGSELQAVEAKAAFSSGETRVFITCVVEMAVNDYVEAIAFQNSGGSLNLLVTAAYSPEFTMQRIS